MGAGLEGDPRRGSIGWRKSLGFEDLTEFTENFISFSFIRFLSILHFSRWIQDLLMCNRISPS